MSSVLTRAKENSGMLVLAGAAGVALGAALPSLIRRFGKKNSSTAAATSSSALPTEHCLTNVRASCERIMSLAQHVSLDEAAIESESAALAATYKSDLAPWDVAYHFCDRQSDLTAQYVLVLDALNFCFWPLQGECPREGIKFRVLSTCFQCFHSFFNSLIKTLLLLP